MNFYELYADTCVEEYVRLDDGIFSEKFLNACSDSEFQHLDRTPLEVEISLDGGLEFPDFILYENVVPLVSEKMRRVFENCGVDNLFYKPITLTLNNLGLAEHYHLALPPRINCLDTSSEIEIEQNEYALPEELLKTVTKIVIDAEKIGRYKIFKLPPFFTNTEIIITESLKNVLENAALSNVNFLEL